MKKFEVHIDGLADADAIEVISFLSDRFTDDAVTWSLYTTDQEQSA